MNDNDQTRLATLIGRDADISNQWTIVGVEPSGTGFKVAVLRTGKIDYLPEQALTGYVDAQTGEVIQNGLQYSRHLWFSSIKTCKGTLPLAAAIDALPVIGIGPSAAQTIAEAIKDWKQFRLAMTQLAKFDIPQSQNESSSLLQAITSTSQCPPEPLAAIFKAIGIGPVTRQRLADWAKSTRADRDMNEIEVLGPIDDVYEVLSSWEKRRLSEERMVNFSVVVSAKKSDGILATFDVAVEKVYVYRNAANSFGGQANRRRQEGIRAWSGWKMFEVDGVETVCEADDTRPIQDIAAWLATKSLAT